MAERRLEERNSCFLRAELTISTLQEPIQAEVLDISEHGLNLKLPDAAIIPDEFIVSVPRRHIRELVVVRRRSETTLGVLIKRYLPKVA